MLKGKLNIVTDGQWGSTGKGKLCAYLAFKHDVDVAVCDFQNNAGHTVLKDGKKTVFQQLPVSALKHDCFLLLNPGCSIQESKLLDEIEMSGAQNRLMIHPNASIITEDCIEFERENLKRIASTLKGCGAAIGMKAMRHPKVKLAKDCPSLERWIGDTTERLHHFLYGKAMVLAEGAQGFDLSVNHGYQYPFVTSRDVTPASIMSNAGVAPQLIGTVYGSLRTFPIRVGNHYENGQMVGSSGPYYSDQREIDWEQLRIRSCSSKEIVERTTVTQKVRRVFTFSFEQLKRFLMVCRPDSLFLNFVNHIDASVEGAKTWGELTPEVKTFCVDLTKELKSFEYVSGAECKIGFLGTGADNDDMVEL